MPGFINAVIVAARRGRVAAVAALTRWSVIAVVPQVLFMPPLRRFTPRPEVDSAAATLRGALEDASIINPTLPGYVLDDQEHVRANAMIFVDSQRSAARIELAEPLNADSQGYV
jgi:hypothetical protein